MKEVRVDSTNQTNTDIQDNNEAQTKAPKKNKKIFAVVFSLLIVLMVIVIFTNDTDPKLQTFGDVSFMAPGEWTVVEESNEDFEGVPSHMIVISNKSYDGSIQTLNRDEKITPEISKSIIDEFYSDLPNPQDVCSSNTGDITYAGAWCENQRTFNSTVEAAYIVMDANTNLYTVIAFTGDKDTKDQVIDTYRSVKYKDKQLYTN